MKNKKAFTLIELLVVVLIIAILAAIALPKYQVARDRAHLSGLMTIGKNVNDALDRRSLFDDSDVNTALDLLDISFKNNLGAECTSGSCTIKVSGKTYGLIPRLNVSGNIGSNYTTFYSDANLAFSRFDVHTETYNSSYTHTLYCYQIGSGVDPDRTRCVKIGQSLGASNAECVDSGSAFCLFN